MTARLALAFGAVNAILAVCLLRRACMVLRFRLGGGCVVGAAYRRGGWPAVERLCREVGA